MPPMPIYTYRCTSCETRFDVRQSMTADPLTECADCKGALQKVFHPSGIAFKGTGFYRTDHVPAPPPKVKR